MEGKLTIKIILIIFLATSFLTFPISYARYNFYNDGNYNVDIAKWDIVLNDKSLDEEHVFDLLKNVPNFKYKVVTNSDAFGVMVDKSAQQKQNISIKQSFDIMMKDPKVPQSTKNFIKLAIIGLIIHIIVLVPLIILLIIDIIKMYVHN